jgi:hypothetical protein
MDMSEENKHIPELRNLTEAEQKAMKLTHYDLRLPNTLTKDQREFIVNMARSVAKNEPFVVIRHDALRYLLRMTMLYRNLLFEVDEDKRWSVSDESIFETLTSEFKPFVDWLQREFKITIEDWER